MVQRSDINMPPTRIEKPSAQSRKRSNSQNPTAARQAHCAVLVAAEHVRMRDAVTRFLRFVAIADGRKREQIAVALDCSTVTVTRFIERAPMYGMTIQCEYGKPCRVTNYGPFDKHKLQLLPWRSMGRKG